MLDANTRRRGILDHTAISARVLRAPRSRKMGFLCRKVWDHKSFGDSRPLYDTEVSVRLDTRAPNVIEPVHSLLP